MRIRQRMGIMMHGFWTNYCCPAETLLRCKDGDLEIVVDRILERA